MRRLPRCWKGVPGSSPGTLLLMASEEKGCDVRQYVQGSRPVSLGSIFPGNFADDVNETLPTPNSEARFESRAGACGRGFITSFTEAGVLSPRHVRVARE
jgi:hypothetical protein